MATKLTKKESLDLFHYAMCNALGWLQGHGIFLDANKKAYDEAKAKLDNPCIEDIYKQILLDGNALMFIDNEGGVYDVNLTIDMVYDRVQNTPSQCLSNIKQECDDVIDSDCILQTVLYNEIMFG